jgi:predicted metal-dependent phosphoesterase TrpH
LQHVIDALLESEQGVSVDYVHGEEITTNLGSQEGNIGLFLPAIDKHTFFNTIIEDGALPRKTFSMGEAQEKRFYLEARKIR